MNRLKEEFLKSPEVKRIHELEKLFNDNEEIKQILQQIKLVQKKLVNAKEFNQAKQYAVYEKEYNSLNEKLLDYPFFEEYVELLEVTHDRLEQIAFLIETKVNTKLKS